MDPITSNDQSLLKILEDAGNGIQYKLFAFIILLFLFINSDIFISRVLSRFDGAVVASTPSSFGTFIQAIILVVMAAIVDMFIKNKII